MNDNRSALGRCYMGLGGEILEIFAPLAGVIRSLDVVPDGVFSQRIIGDGIAIEPLDGLVRAPFKGIVVALPATSHAITIRSPGGVEVLIHVGIDTVALGGRGFSSLVSIGQSVQMGDALIEIDLDMIAQDAPSLVTPIVIVSGQLLDVISASGLAARSGDLLMTAHALAVSPDCAGSSTDFGSTAQINTELKLPHGLHARPSAQLAEMARSFGGAVSVSFGDKSADATSVTGLMTLGTRLGSEIEIKAIGDRAREAVTSISRLLSELAQSEHKEAQAAPVVAAIPLAESTIAMSAKALSAIIAAPGLALGPVFRLDASDATIDKKGRGLELEHGRLRNAIDAISDELTTTIANTHGPAKAIAEAHLAIVQDRALRSTAEQSVLTGVSAEFGWRSASRTQEEALLAADSPRLRERAIDLRDVERRLIAQMGGIDAQSINTPPPGSIVVCDDIQPSVLLAMPKDGVAGICTARGGATSHAAILAASRGIPMLVAAGDSVLVWENGHSILLDALSGRIDPAPSASAADAVAQCAAQLRSEAVAAKLDAQQPCVLADGTRIEIFANLANLTDARDAVDNGAEGCGLLRTEFIFADASQAPDEQSQCTLYSQFADVLQGRPLIIRTLDVGGDKPIAYLPFAEEANPALGMRGIRFTLSELDILRTQLRAMLKGVRFPGQLRIMLPMVVEAEEVELVRAMVRAEAADLGIDAQHEAVQVGIMVETPAAALLADQLAAHADFFSIGTNDLSQYVLAMDRGNAALAPRVDSFHPAVLRSIALTATGAASHGRWLGICGGLASDYRASPLLVGLGCNELSAVPTAIPRIKQTLRRWTMAKCRDLAERALSLESAAAVRTLVSGEVQ